MPASTLTDPVGAIADDLLARIDALDLVKNDGVEVYDVDDLKFRRTKLSLPCIGVVFNSLTAVSGSQPGRRGRMGQARFDVYYIIGYDKENRVHGKFHRKATALMAAVRGDLLADCGPAPNDRQWEFVLEQPVFIQEGMVSYLQRWQVRTVTLC